jgi:DNA-3-methyladenine glycosylase II
MTTFDTTAALKHFKKTDPKMAELFKNALKHKNPITIPKGRTRAKYFEAIVASIVSQQISVKAADAVWKKVKAGVGAITPENLKDRTPEELREFGLSRQKAGYIIKSAHIWESLPTAKFSQMDNEEVIAELTKLYGIGRWTAEMFLMFTLARPDVFSMGDWGLMISIKNNYKLDPKKHVKKIEKLTATWSPHRTLASLTLWHHKDS